MKTLLSLEEAAQFALSIFLFSKLTYAWWVFPALLLIPDLSMIGYVINTQMGAITYNAVHHKGVGIVMGIAGFALGIQWLLLSGIILFGHSSMDRMLGYGLKYPDNFKHTHLGMMGKG